MNKWSRSILLALCVTAGVARAGEPQIQVQQAWARATVPQAPTAAGYLTLVNPGKQADRLVSVESTVAQRVEVHSMSMDGGVMRMRQLTDGVPLPAGATVTLGPSGTHLMLIGPAKPLTAGQHFSATLHFAHGAAQVVQFQVLPIGAAGPDPVHAMEAMHP